MKYIIEIKPEYEGTTKGIIVLGIINNCLCVDGLAVEELEELNAEYINNNFADISKKVEEAYQKGYDEAKRIYQNPNAESDNQKGLNDAWEAAREIARMWEEDTDTEHRVVIDDSIRITLDSMTASEAIAKLKAYEQRKKADAEIKVGDEVKNTLDFMDNAVGYFFGDSSDGCYKVLRYVDGKFKTGIWNKKDFKRTGKHSDAVVQLLEAMKGEQRDCSTCKHQVASSIECVDCGGFKKWEPKCGDA